MPNKSGFTLPSTHNCVLAIHLDTKSERERVILGELHEVQRRIQGAEPSSVLADEIRPYGTFILECSQQVARRLADARAALCDSAGRKKSPFFERSRETLEAMWLSDNLVHRFVALRMWQAYEKARGIKDYDLMGELEDITLPLRFDLMADVARWQENNPALPLAGLMPEYFMHTARVMYAGGRRLTQYVMADSSLMPLVIYYLSTVYTAHKYVRRCRLCDKAFMSEDAGKTLFCSEGCRKAQRTENKRRFDDKARETPYEREHKAHYMYWYNRMSRLRRLSPGDALLGEAEAAFAAFRDGAVRRKRAVAEGRASLGEYRDWLIAQGHVIDGIVRRAKELGRYGGL